jgi:hypothetical protein
MMTFAEEARRVLPTLLWVAGLVLVVTMSFALLGWINGRPLHDRRTDVAMVGFQPMPEGPVAPPFSRTGQVATRPLTEIEAFIPDPLPHSVWQGVRCVGGLDVLVTLADGRTITYGPCRYPQSISVLQAHMNDAYRRDFGQ